MVGVFLKTHVLELEKKSFLKSKRGVRLKRAIEKSWIIPFCCLYSHVCSNKSALMSHYEAKKSDIKS